LNVKTLTKVAAGIGILLCASTGGTGYWLKSHPEIKDMHLMIAITCICVSTVAHILTIVSLRTKE
jgi:hypothetical protein